MKQIEVVRFEIKHNKIECLCINSGEEVTPDSFFEEDVDIKAYVAAIITGSYNIPMFEYLRHTNLEEIHSDLSFYLNQIK